MKDLVKHLSDSQRKCHHYSSFLAESHIPQCQSQSNSEVLYRKHVVNSSAREYERQRQIRSSVRMVTGAGGGNAAGRSALESAKRGVSTYTVYKEQKMGEVAS